MLLTHWADNYTLPKVYLSKSIFQLTNKYSHHPYH